MIALAVFHDHGDHWFCRLLKPGFRHVFAAVQSGDYWIFVDPRAGTPVIEVIAQADYDLAQFYRDQGFSVAEAEVRQAEPRWPWAYANCVGAVKIILGIQDSFVLTPHQLWRHLTC